MRHIIHEGFNSEENEQRARHREQARIQKREQALEDAKTAEEKKRLADDRNEKLQRERQEKADLERRNRYLENREAYRREKENKQKQAQIKERYREFCEQNSARSTSILDEGHDHLASSPLMFSQKSPRQFTLDLAGGNIAEQIEQHETKIRAEHETDLLEDCIKAALDMNESIDAVNKKGSLKETFRLIKIQRNALLGTLAGCMEHLKNLKNDSSFSNTFARKFRNYLFKGKRFLLHEEQSFENAKQLNMDIINMVNEIICCLRSQEMDGIDAFAEIKSALFDQLKQEAENFKPSDVPSLSLCTKGITLANLELKLYENSQNIDPILLSCARQYSVAARGSFALWIRDLHCKKYNESQTYQRELDQYIEEGNQVRHRDFVNKGPIAKC